MRTALVKFYDPELGDPAEMQISPEIDQEPSRQLAKTVVADIRAMKRSYPVLEARVQRHVTYPASRGAVNGVIEKWTITYTFGAFSWATQTQTDTYFVLTNYSGS